MTVLRDIETVIIHVPKTGGSSVRWPAINKFGNRYACQHCHIKMLPENYSNYRKITFVRHPLSWYASRFFYDKKKWFDRNSEKKEPFTDVLSNQYSLSFDETLARMLDLTKAFSDEQVLTNFKNALKREVNNNYQAWWVSYFDDIDGITSSSFQHKSLYQWFCDICGIYDCDAIYRLEDQYEFGMKKEFGEEIPIIHKNKTGRLGDDSIYNFSTRKMVNDKENTFIERFYM